MSLVGKLYSSKLRIPRKWKQCTRVQGHHGIEENNKETRHNIADMLAIDDHFWSLQSFFLSFLPESYISLTAVKAVACVAKSVVAHWDIKEMGVQKWL